MSDEKDLGVAAKAAALSGCAPSPTVSALRATPANAGCPPADFNDAYRADVCRIGQGEACCRYLALGAVGWSCEKRGNLRLAIDRRVDQMSAKSDNCDGVYDARPAFVLLRKRFEYAAGTIIYRAKGHDYGCASDDAYFTGKPHTSMTVDPSGDYPFFTVPDEDFAPANTEQGL